MIPFTTEEIQTFTSPQRTFRVTLYNPTVDTMQSVVLGSATSGLDVSQYVSGGALNEDLGEAVHSTLSLDLSDPTQQFHPDFGIRKRYAADRAFVRVEITDTNWTRYIPLFTGHVTGSPAYSESRDGGHTLKITALDRSARFNKRKMTSRAFPRGTDYGAMAREVAFDLMGLSPGEVAIPLVTGRLTAHDPVQFVDVTPQEMLQDILWTLYMVPRFDGAGILTTSFWDTVRGINLLYDSGDLVRSIEHPQAANSIPSLFRVIGLDGTISQAKAPKQKLVDIEQVIGWFDRKYERDIYFSEDKTQRAENAEMVVIQSIKDGILRFGDESFVQVSEFHGRLVVETPYNPLILALVIAAYVTAANYGDISLPFGGLTIPIGRILQGVAQMLVQTTIMQVQRAVYEIHGEPFEFIYREISDATCLNIPDAEHVEWERKNHLVTDHQWAKDLAKATMLRFIAENKPRNLGSFADLRLETGDRLQLQDGRKLFVKTVNTPVGRAASLRSLGMVRYA